MFRTALDLATPGFRTDAGRGADDVRDDIRLTEWEMALSVLADMSDAHPQSAEFWQCLEHIARLMHDDGIAAWCRWRCQESLNGLIRADLVLAAPEDGGRRSALPGDGTLRPMWDIGLRTTTGETALASARVRVEFATSIGPGQQGSIRLAPLDPPQWRNLATGDVITMHEANALAGIAEITEILPPTASAACLPVHL